MGDGNPSLREQVFRYIVDYKREHDGIAPAVGEIARVCVMSVSTVKYHLFMLEREHRIRVLGRRAIEVVGGVWNWPDEE